MYLEQCQYDRHYFVDNVAKFDVAILDGNWMDYSARGRLGSVLDLIEFAASKAKLVVVMAAPKQFDVNPVEAYSRSLVEKRPFDLTKMSAEGDAEEKRANGLLEEAVRKYPNVLFFDRDSMFTAAGVPSDVTEEHVPFTLEGNHVSKYGSKAAGAACVRSRKYKEFVELLRAGGHAPK